MDEIISSMGESRVGDEHTTEEDRQWERPCPEWYRPHKGATCADCRFAEVKPPRGDAQYRHLTCFKEPEPITRGYFLPGNCFPACWHFIRAVKDDA